MALRKAKKALRKFRRKAPPMFFSICKVGNNLVKRKHPTKLGPVLSRKQVRRKDECYSVAPPNSLSLPVIHRHSTRVLRACYFFEQSKMLHVSGESAAISEQCELTVHAEAEHLYSIMRPWILHHRFSCTPSRIPPKSEVWRRQSRV